MLRQWCNLPLELVEVIESKLTLYFDKVRIRMVCKSWRSHLPILQNHGNPLLLHNLSDESEGTHGLFNPIDNKIYKIDLKDAKRKYIVGCSFGWVAIVDELITSKFSARGPGVYLIHMFTNARINLPPRVGNHHDGITAIKKIVLSSSPRDKKFIAVAIYHYRLAIAYCKCGDKTWKYIDHMVGTEVKDAMFHEDKLYVLSCDQNLCVFEEIGQFAKPKLVMNIFEHYYRSTYLVKPPAGGIAAVYVNWKAFWDPLMFLSYKIDLTNAERVRIYDSGDDIMFLDCISALMVSSTDENRKEIYLTKDVTSELRLDLDNTESNFSVFNLQNDTLRSLSNSKISSDVFCPREIWVKLN